MEIALRQDDFARQCDNASGIRVSFGSRVATRNSQVSNLEPAVPVLVFFGSPAARGWTAAVAVLVLVEVLRRSNTEYYLKNTRTSTNDGLVFLGAAGYEYSYRSRY
eukprot:scaffold317338_cov25-Prasinocladus_malaysianus.AAC.1